MMLRPLNHKRFWLVPLMLALSACGENLSIAQSDEEKLQQQEQKQGYPILIATPTIADYGLPFCEKRYCIEVEIFDFKSQDQWFNQFTNERIADLIRRELGIREKMSLQQVINLFVQRSDDWRDLAQKKANEKGKAPPSDTPNEKNSKSNIYTSVTDSNKKYAKESNKDLHVAYQAWRIYAQPQVILQKKQYAFLKINIEYDVAGYVIPEQSYFYAVDRKAKKQISLYDMVDANYRLALQNLIQQQYVTWKKTLTAEQSQQLPDKVYWASQDWLWSEEKNTIVIYYRPYELGLEQAKPIDPFVVELPTEHIKQWILPEYLSILQPTSSS